MADIALLQAVESSVRTLLGETTAGKNVGIHPDAQPPPFAGQWYVAIDGCDSTFGNDPNSLSLDEEFSVIIIVTYRMAYAPRDRVGAQDLLTGKLRQKARQVAVSQHMNYSVMNAANTTLGVLVNGFVEPLKLQSISRPQARGADWVYAEDSDNPPTVFTITIQLGGARRVQTLESMT